VRITLNGKDEILPEGITVAQLISLKKINPDTIIVEYNYELVKSESWPNIMLKEDDRLEILRLVGGG